jgi:hypothetical protein
LAQSLGKVARFRRPQIAATAFGASDRHFRRAPARCGGAQYHCSQKR